MGQSAHWLTVNRSPAQNPHVGILQRSAISVELLCTLASLRLGVVGFFPLESIFIQIDAVSVASMY